MKWVKAPDELKNLPEGAMKGTDCEKRPMFGYPAYFIDKNMFIGLFQDKVFAVFLISNWQLSAPGFRQYRSWSLCREGP